jgi:hypothetical protein
MKTRAIAILAAWILCSVCPLFAHHSFESEFDVNKPVHIEGKVTKMEWGNPHVYLEMDVLDSRGARLNWRVELTSPNDLTTAGMTRSSAQVGGEVVVDGFAAKSGARLVGSNTLTVKSTGQIVMTSQAKWHHSYMDTYDGAKIVQLTGTLIRMDQAFPNATVHMLVTMPNGQIQQWLVETPALQSPTLSRWTDTYLRSGDVIQVGGAAARDGSAKLLGRELTLIARFGRTLDSPRQLLKN